MFDDLLRNSQVLQDSCEEQFIRFITNSEHNRKRWENSEVECQRLNIEMNKALQDKHSLELKLENARTLLDVEVKVRKRVEGERDKLRGQLNLLKDLIMDDQFSDDVKMNKIRSLGRVGDEYDPEEVFTPYRNAVTTPKGILKQRPVAMADDTEDLSVVDVDDLSFDDTQDLCNSRRRSGKRSRSRSRSRSQGRQTAADHFAGGGGGLTRQDTVALLESVASPRTPDTAAYNLRQSKRHRRSRSVVAFHQQQLNTPTSTSTTTTTTDTDTAEIRPRAYSASTHNAENNLDQGFQTSQLPETGHNFVTKTVLKAEKCVVCSKRMGFGRVVLKCTACRENLHKECVDMMQTICTPHAGSPDVCRTPGGVKRSASVKKPYFASPMLR